MWSFLRSLALIALGGLAGHALASEAPDRYRPLVAAPDHHRPILENERVRVLDVVIAAGDTVPAHRHDLPSLFITLSPADLVFRDLSGETVRQVRRAREGAAAPRVEWRDPAPAPRLVSNVDSVALHALRVELKTGAE